MMVRLVGAMVGKQAPLSMGDGDAGWCSSGEGVQQ